MTSEELYKKMRIEPIYFRYDFEDCVVRSEPGVGWFVKFKDKPEFKAVHGSKIVAEAILGMDMITKDEYDNYGKAD